MPTDILDPKDIEIILLKAEVERWKSLAFSPIGDNHHNALTCPHCNPNGCVFALPVSPGQKDPWQKTQESIDRGYARKGRFGYEAHPEFGKDLPKKES